MRDDASVVTIAYGDGAQFDAPEPLGPPGAQPELAQLPGGRLGDGRVRLTVVDQNTGHRLHGTHLRGDAACP